MFLLTTKNICLLDKQKRELGIVSGQRSDEMERYERFTFSITVAAPFLGA